MTTTHLTGAIQLPDGTVLACLVVLAGLPPAEAIAWTRANHHHRAVETPWQRRWVARFPLHPTS